MSRERKKNQGGFKALIGKTIKSVDASAINQVILTDTKGNRYLIDAEAGILGIPVIFLSKDAK